MLNTVLTSLYFSIPAVIAVTILTFIFSDEKSHSRLRGPILGSILSGFVVFALLADGLVNTWGTIEPPGGWGFTSLICLLLSPVVGAAYATFSALGSSLFFALSKRASLNIRLACAGLGAGLGVQPILPIFEFLG